MHLNRLVCMGALFAVMHGAYAQTPYTVASVVRLSTGGSLPTNTGHTLRLGSDVYTQDTLDPLAVYGWGVNESGQAVGTSLINSPYKTAFVTGADGVGITALMPGTSGSRSFATGINDGGQVVGFSTTSTAGYYSGGQAFFAAADGTIHTLGGTGSRAFGVNSSGQVAGMNAGTAFITDANGGALHSLGTLTGSGSSYGTGINDKGQVVGFSSSAAGSPHAFVTDVNGGAMHDLGALYGGSSYASGINEHGQVVGSSVFKASSGLVVSHAFITDADGTMRDLGSLDNRVAGMSSFATGVNDNGIVVGYGMSSGGWHAFITGTNGQGMYDLNSLVSGLSLSYAWGVNNENQVLAQGSGGMYLIGLNTIPVDSGGGSPGVIPEPGTLALMVGGLVVVWRRRRIG